MSRPLTIAMTLVIVLVGCAAWGVSIRAEDRTAAQDRALQERALQEERGAWFRSLKQPVTGMSCCDVSDCRRTEADWRGGQWWAVVENNWTPIPREKQLDKLSIDGDAYVCAGPRGTIYCFVPPSMAM
jgi:hypothetical protein